MTKRNLPAANRQASAAPRQSNHFDSDRRFVPRPFQRRPWLLAFAAMALAAWLAFLSLMAWQPWAAKKRPPPLREKEAAQRATGE